MLSINIFSGSGQTNIAAERAGRRHIGIETQSDYIDYAVRNIDDEIKQETIPFKAAR